MIHILKWLRVNFWNCSPNCQIARMKKNIFFWSIKTNSYVHNIIIASCYDYVNSKFIDNTSWISISLRLYILCYIIFSIIEVMNLLWFHFSIEDIVNFYNRCHLFPVLDIQMSVTGMSLLILKSRTVNLWYALTRVEFFINFALSYFN